MVKKRNRTTNARKNRRGISLMVSYVLLVVIAVSVSIIVYGYLKLYAPAETVGCPREVNLIIEDAICDPNYNNSMGPHVQLTLANRGLFNVSAVFVRFAEEGRRVRQQVNTGREIFPDKPLAPGADFTTLYAVNKVYSGSEDNYVIEIQPAIIKEGIIIPCEEVTAIQPVSCTGVIQFG